MSGRRELDEFLRTDPHDVGCSRAMALLPIYADLVVTGEPAEQRYPGIAAHLHACGPCGGDFEALLSVVRHDVISGAIFSAAQVRRTTTWPLTGHD